MNDNHYKRTLIYIPVIHSGPDMGSIADDITGKGIAELGDEIWQLHIKTVEKYWDVIEYYCDLLKFKEKGLKIYQDGMVADGDIAMKIIEDGVKMGSRNYEIISRLISRGAEIVKTEDFKFVKRELKLYKSIAATDSLLIKLLKILLIRAKRKFLLKKRDTFIASSITETLKAGETGLIFLGAYHQILNKLPEDIKVLQVKEISKVRQYQKLLPFQSKYKPLFQQITHYLIDLQTTN